jgi:hypothetical protein
MNQETFDKVVGSRIDKLRSTLDAKASEYSRGDRLSNFKKIAGLRGVPAEDACMALVVKHFVALNDFVQDLKDEGVNQPYDRWDEKIGDVIAYMVLMDALAQERLDLSNYSQVIIPPRYGIPVTGEETIRLGQGNISDIETLNHIGPSTLIDKDTLRRKADQAAVIPEFYHGGVKISSE